MSSQVYGIGGLVGAAPGVLSGQGAPPASFIGKLGQQYFDVSVSPPVGYIFNGLTWDSGGNAYATTSTPGLVQLTGDVVADQSSTTLVPHAKAVFDYGQSLVLAGANIAETGVTGITNLATDAQAVAGTATVPGVTALAVQPSNLAAVFAAPPAIGGTTRAAALFTTLAANGLFQASASATILTGATALNLASDASTGAVNIATGAGARTVTIGNVTGATAVNVNVGTGGSIWTTTNSTLALRSGTGAIQIGADAAAKTVTIGNVTGATAVNVNTGTGGCAFTTTNGGFNLQTGTGAIQLGADAAAKTITIGNVTGATAVNVNSGTASCAWTTTNGAFSLITGTGAVSLGADSAAKSVTVGNTTTTSSLTLNAGSGGIALTSGQTVKVTSKATADSPYAVLGNDYFIGIDSTAGAVTVTLPGAPATGRNLIVMDIAGQAAANNITIDGNGKNITLGGTSAATKIIATAYKGVELYYNGTTWSGGALA